MKETVWKVSPRKYDDLILQILINRGIVKSGKEKKAIENFLKPDFKLLNDPFLLSGMKKAVERIKKAKQNNEKIGIFADYDADGIPGGALLARTFKKLGIPFEIFIPTRDGGYGLSKHGIDYLLSKKCSLIVTVDLGIKNIEEAKYCKDKVDLIITDHHTLGEVLPDALAVINPKIGHYPDKNICGCAVAFKLIEALGSIFKEIDESFLKWNLDLVAISTISDVVPLIGENRILASYGLIVLRKTKNLGLQSLYKVAAINPKAIDSYTVAFQIGPRINAPGRVDHATKSYELLVGEDKEETESLARWLNEKNEERQRQMETVRKEAMDKIIKNKLEGNKIIITDGKWPKGIVGPVASRLVEEFCRPVILFSDEESCFSGSARSIEDVNILNLLDSISNILYKYGGHKGAAGVTVLKNKFHSFINKIVLLANKVIDSSLLVKKIDIETVLNEKDLKNDLFESLKKLEPFGMENTKPTFLLEKGEIVFRRVVGKDAKHLSLKIKTGKKEVKAIYFNYNKDKVIENHTLYDFVFSVSQDEWNNQKQLCLNIVDLKKA